MHINRFIKAIRQNHKGVDRNKLAELVAVLIEQVKTIKEEPTPQQNAISMLQELIILPVPAPKKNKTKVPKRAPVIDAEVENEPVR